MKTLFSLLTLSSLVAFGAIAHAQDSVSAGDTGGAAAPAAAAPPGGAPPDAASSTAQAGGGAAAAVSADPQAGPPAPQSATAAEPLLPAFCPTGLCYTNAFDGTNPICAARAKGSAPGQPSCANWSLSGPPTMPSVANPGTTTQ